MTRPLIFLSVACGLLLPATAPAQNKTSGRPEEPDVKTLADLAGAVAQTPRESPASRYEDIEIFRRILDTALFKGPLGRFGQVHSYGLALSPDGKVLAEGWSDDGGVRLWDVHSDQQLARWIGHNGVSDGQGAEGVYLPGYGYVFCVTMPALGSQSVAGSAKPGPKPPSQWEQVRDELRGGKPKRQQAKSAPEEPPLADAVLKLLADNGRHFSLPENQNVTVAITLRSVGACVQCHVAASVQTGDRTSGSEAGQPLGVEVDSSASAASQALVSEALTRLGERRGAAAKDADAKKTEASNMTHLGDIRLRQGRGQDAIDAYQKAIDLYEKLPDWKQRVARMDKEGKQYLADVAEAHTKIAQAYLMMGDSAKAMATLKQAQTYLKRTVGAGNMSGTFSAAAEQTPTALPEKLIISASKQTLDDVATGKLSFEEFKKKATVEHLTFPAGGKAAAKPG